MEKCTCEFCKFPTTGIALDVVTFVDQVPAKLQMLDFLRDSFFESDERKKARGYAENKIGILRGEWGLGKTQLLKCFRTAINNSAGVLDKLVGELEDDERADQIKSFDLTAVLDELEKEDAEFAQDRPTYASVFDTYRGIAFRIDATKFRNELNPGQNKLVTLWNIVLRRCNLDTRIDSDGQIDQATKSILDHFNVNRLFIFFDELEGLQGVESAGFEFGKFVEDFAFQVKRVLDNEVTSDVSILLAVISTVWDSLVNEFDALGALESRSVFIDLERLDLECAYQLILSRCGTLDNAPFSEGAVRTLLRSSASNPRYLARLCRQVQPALKDNQTTQYKDVLKHLKGLPPSSRKHYTFDQRGLDELLDGALTEFSEDKPHVELLRILAGEIREVSPYELREALGIHKVAPIRDALEDLCRTTIAGIYPVTRVMQLDTEKVLMSRTQINQQKRRLEDPGWLHAPDIQIDGQRLKVYDMDYRQKILGAIATYRPDTEQSEYFLPVSESEREELSALWQCEEPIAVALARTLQPIGKTGIQKYRLSQAALERVFPWHGAKEPPFEWVPESFWHDAHAHLHDPRTPKEDMRGFLMDGLLAVARSLGARCSKLDRFSFRMELSADAIKHRSYDDDKGVSCLVTFVSSVSEINNLTQKRRVAEHSVDFLASVSSTRLSQKPDRIETIEGRPTIEVVYYELDGKTQFKLQLLAYLAQEAADQGWYSPDKQRDASKMLSHDCLGNVVGLWIQQVRENGYLVSNWELDEASLTEPRRPLRAIRDAISIIPGFPVLESEFDVELKRAGAREGMEPELFKLLEDNRQIARLPSGKVNFELLPTQQRIVKVAQRFRPKEGEKTEDFAARIQQHFWRGRRTNLEQELTRHVTTVESLGYFDPARDLDVLVRAIQQNIKAALAEDDGASIDRYAYQIRRAKGAFGAKGAKRLQDELSYYRGHHERHRDEIHVVDQHLEWLVPRVIRRRLIEIDRDVGEIIAEGKEHFEKGKSAVAQAGRELRTAYYDLAGDGTDTKIRDHVKALKDYARYPLLEQAGQAHREGRIHDDKKGQESASDFLGKLQEELNTLREQKEQVENDLQSYNDAHQLAFSKAKDLSEAKGATERVAPVLDDLQNLDPKGMRSRFKRKFEGEGFKAGQEEIQRALQEINEIEEKLEEIAEFTDDLAALEDIVAVLGRLQEQAEGFLKRVGSSEVEVLSKRFKWRCFDTEAQDLLTRIGNWKTKWQRYRDEYDASKHRSYIEAGLKGVEDHRNKLEQLENTFADLSSQVRDFASELEQTNRRLGKSITDHSNWADEAIQRVSDLWRQEAQDLTQKLFDTDNVSGFEELLQEDADIRQHVVSAADVRTRMREIYQWLTGVKVEPDDYQGGEEKVANKARELAPQLETIRQKAEQLVRSKAYHQIGEQLNELLTLPDSPMEHFENASGLVVQVDRDWQALKKLALQSIEDARGDATRYIEALSKIQLLEPMPRSELLERLKDKYQEFKDGSSSYAEVNRSVKKVERNADEMAKQRMSEQVKGVGGDMDSVLALALVKEVHESESRDESKSCDLKRILQLDSTEGSAIVLRLVQEGVFQGDVRLGDRK